MNFTEPLRRLASDQPGALAVVLPSGRRVDYASLDATVDAIGHRLLAAGIGAGDTVVVPAARPWRVLALTLALGRIGAAAAPPEHPPDLARASIGFEPGDEVPALRRIGADRRWLRPVAAAEPVRMRGGGGAVASCFSSSGTTGPVKSIVVTHDAIAARIEATRLGVPLPPRARAACAASLGTGYGMLSALRTLGDGGTLVLVRGADEAPALLDEHRVDHLTGSPYRLDAIAAACARERRRAPALSSVAFAGGAMPAALLERVRDWLCERVVCVYGATEIGCAAAGDMAELAAVPGAVGRAIPGVRIDAIDGDGRPLPPGEEGRLRLAGAGLALGYAGQRSEDFAGGAYVTGDLGSVTAEGFVRLGGRVSEVIDIGGMRILPGPIEEALFTVPGVRDAAVVGRPGPTGLPQVWAAIEATADVGLDAIARALDAHGVQARPAVIARVAGIPRNEGGKVDRRALAALLARVAAPGA